MLSILLADDEPNVLDLLRVTLDDRRVRLFEAVDGLSALMLAEALVPDLVFLDVHLPDVDGLEVCRRLRANEQLSGTKIVMLTAAAQQEDIARGLAAGADHYLTKPFSPLHLLSLVESLIPRAVLWRPE